MAVCYRFIYQKKCTTNKSLLDFIRSLIGYYIFIVKYRRHRISQDQEMDDFLEKNGEFRVTLFLQGGSGTTCVLAIPSITVLIMRFFRYSWFSVVIFLAGANVWIKTLKESRIKIMILLNEGQKFLYQFERIKKRMMNNQTVSKIQTKEKRIKIGKKFIVQIAGMWFISAGGILVVILSLRDMLKGAMLPPRKIEDTIFGSPAFIALWLLTALSFTIFCLKDQGTRDAIKRRFTYAKYLKNSLEIHVCASVELCDLMDEFLHMCDLLDIKEVNIVLGDSDNVKVCSYVENGQTPVILIGYDVFNKAKEVYGQEYTEIIKMLTAHELVHIYYKDITWMRKVAALTLLFYGVMMAVAVVGAERGNMVCVLIAIACIGLYCTISGILSDERYWNQVKEFRADAIGMEISQTSAEVFEKAMNCVAEEEEEGSVENKKKTGLLYWWYKRKVEQQIHPSMERRIYEVRRGRRWRKREYIRYLWMVCRNVVTGKGWKL